LAEKHGNCESDSPWLPRPNRPDGARRPGAEQRSGDEHPKVPLPVRNELAERQWLVRLIARRAVEILAEGSDEKQDGNIREV
jgi:hypothetical protein